MSFFGKGRASKVNQAAVDAVILSYHLPIEGEMVSLAQLVKRVQVDGAVVTLSLEFDARVTKSPEVLADDLTQMMKPYGVKNVMLSLIRQKKPAAVQVSGVVNPANPANAPTQQNQAGASNQAGSSTKEGADAAAQPQQPQPKPQDTLKPHPRIKQVILVSSAKGGVGKSTTAVNLALALKASGLKTGVLDADIYGPSVPAMLGVKGVMPMVENEAFVPIEAHGLAVLSIGNLLADDNTPVVWRGPKATGALMQLFTQTNWPDLDVLIVDMPPGTGDIQLTLSQRIKVDGALIVTTPQDVAAIDAKKGVAMFKKVGIEVLGLVENMSMHRCENCGHESHVFGEGGADLIAKEEGVEVLMRLPLMASIQRQADQGAPSVVAADAAAQYYFALADRVKDVLARLKPQTSNRIF